MRTGLRKCAFRGVYSGLAMIAIVVSYSQAAQPPPEHATPAKLEALLQARLDAARTAYEEAVKGIQQTKRTGDSLIRLAKSEDVYAWSVRWLNAQRDMRDKKKNQVAALEAHVKRMKDLQQRVASMHQSALVSSLEARAVEFYRAEAELWLAREKSK